MTLTIKDIRDQALYRSGFSKVAFDPAGSKIHPYRANAGRKSAGTVTWYGPRRATAEEAAQDYCDYMNGQATPATPALKSAGHTRTMPVPAVPPPTDRERELLTELRELRNQRMQGSQGFIYCIAESYYGNGGHLYNNMAVKVGWARDPDQRIKALQTANPRVLKILGTIPGTEDDEQALHAELRGDNVLQEWFRPTKALLAKFGIERQIMGVKYFTVREAS